VTDEVNEPSQPPSFAPPFLTDPGALEFRPLDRRVIKLWRINSAFGSLVLLVATGVGCGFVAAAKPGWSGWLLGAWLVLFVVQAVLWIWYPSRAYRAWGYRLDGRVLETRSGVWFRVIKLLPLSRLQHVDLERGPLERAFGLASLVLHTAGTHDASITVPGLEAAEAVRLRDQLVVAGGDDAV